VAPDEEEGFDFLERLDELSEKWRRLISEAHGLGRQIERNLDALRDATACDLDEVEMKLVE